MLELLLDIIEDLVLVAAEDGRVTATSTMWEAALGYRADQLVGRPWRDLIEPEDLPAGAELPPQFQARVRASDGALRPYRVRLASNGTRAALIAFFPIESATQAGSTRAGFIEHLLAQIPALLWTTDRTLHFTSSSGAGLKPLGLKPGQVVGLSLHEYFGSEDPTLPPIAAHISALGGIPATYDFVWESSTWATHVEPMSDDAGNVVGTIGLAVDMTLQRRIEAALRAERERVLVTLRSIGDGVIATDREGRVTLLNHVAEQLTGWSEAEALGQPLLKVFNIINEHTRAPMANPVSLVFERGCVVGLANHTVLIARDGTERVIADSGAPIVAPGVDGGLQGAVLVFRDVTHEQRVERELRTTQRMQALGVLAGGIAHDFNNMLAMIMGNISVARRFTSDTRLTGILEDVEQASRRATALTRQLLTFSHGGSPVRELVELGPLIRTSVDFALRGAKSVCDLHIAEDLMAVEVDEGQLGQVLSNLIINAEEAMPNGGTVHVDVQNHELRADEAGDTPPGSYVAIEVRDEGVGIAPEHVDRVFEPFFSTKSRGSGLGLSIAHGIVTAHGGRIEARSRLGEGTTIKLLLPAASGAVRSQVAATPMPAPSGRAHVLVMDDEPALRAAAARMLEALGYSCESVNDGSDVCDAYLRARADGTPFAVVVLDLTVPGGIGGVEALRRLREIDPDVRAVVSSGYANDPTMAEYRNRGFAGVLIKPYGVDQLGELLDGLLRARSPSPKP